MGVDNHSDHLNAYIYIYTIILLVNAIIAEINIRYEIKIIRQGLF